jgi:hypothetical protein
MSRGAKLRGLLSVFCRNFYISVGRTAVWYFFNFGRSIWVWNFVICGCMWSMEFIEEFVYKISICCRIEENHEEHWLSWSGSTSPGRNPNSSQQPCIKILERTRFSVTKTNLLMRGHAVEQLVDALCYKPEGWGFESWWGLWISSIYLILPAAQ